MTNLFSTLFITYLIFPIVVLLVAVIAVIIAKKNNLLGNKRLVVYTLLSVLILAAPALFGFLDYGFMPYFYIVLAGVYFILGWYNDRLLPWVFKKETMYRTKITYIIIEVIIGMLLFALVFNLCNELKYGFWASTSMLPFVLASLLIRTHEVFIHIPAPVYKVWIYGSTPGYSEPDEIDHSKLKVVKVELFKQQNDTEPIRINAKVPEELLFGDWVKLLFDDYNKRTAHAPINVHSEDDQGWIFYVKSWLLAPRRHLDYELTVKGNRIKENHLIVAKRVKNI